MQILYVEDDPHDADLLRQTLERVSFEATVDVATTLAAARQRLQTGPACDIVLLDLRLPDGNGLDLLAEIRRQGLPLAVVILTGVGDEETAVAALKAGADDYLPKNEHYLARLPAVLEDTYRRLAAAQKRRAKILKVLYVEHSSLDIDLTRHHLARHAPYIHLEAVFTADEALGRLPASPEAPCPYDMLLLDFQLPGLNALELLKVIRQERRLDLPVVLVTGRGDEQVAVQAVRLGASDYVVKHSHYLYELPAVLENAFYRHQLAREQAALQASEAHYRRFFENDLTADFICLADGRLQDCNPAFLQLFGFADRQQALQSSLAGLFPSPEAYQAFVDRLTRQGRLEYHEQTLRRLDGQTIHVVLNAIALAGDGGEPLQILGYLFDDTRRKKLEEQVNQLQKMEAIGRLAGGIAHDFNNLLVPIIGYTELGMMNVPPDNPLHRDLTRIRKAAQRAADLARQILAFSRQQPVEMTAVDLNQLVYDFQDILRRLIGEDILLQVRAAENLPPIQADRSQIEQVLLNLAVNARDAMPNGGELVIETGAVTLDEVYTATHPGIEPGRYVLLAVSDTGVGMDAETRQRIFEPFFTTKRKGEGTGLGLATVYNIIRHHRGSIWVYSEPGQGTVFKIYLPTAEQVEKAEAEAPEAAPPGQGETILVVEDEAAVRQLVAETLQAHGYTVLSAEHPARAVEQVRARSQPVDLLLTDVVMPSMNGMELYRRLAEIWPEMKVLYMSGYTDNAVVQHGILQEGLAFLQKPFTIPDLLRRVRQTLESQLPQ